MQLSPEAVARAENQLNAREQVLHAELAKHPMVLPGLAVGLGIPLFIVSLPWAAIKLANANFEGDEGYDSSGADHERRVGAGLLVASAVGLAGVIYGALTIRRARKQRLLAEYELRAIAVQRSMLASQLPAAALAPSTAMRAVQKPDSAQFRPMTKRGRILLTGGVDLSYIDHVGYFSLRFTPGFGFFTRDRLALGAFMEVSRAQNADTFSYTRDLTVGGGFRLIYELGLGERTGLWFWPYLGYAWRQIETEVPLPSFCGAQDNVIECPFRGPQEQKRIDRVFRLGMLLPVMFHLAESWAIGIGPRFEYDYGTASKHDFATGIASQLAGSF